MARFSTAFAALVLLLCALGLPAFAQTDVGGASAGAADGASLSNADGPAVTFTLDFPASVPSHYSVRVFKDGKASYESVGKLTPEADGDPFSYDFAMSTPNLTRIFELVATAKYFDGDVDYRKGRQANTGRKVLAYRDGTQQSEAVFNYSSHQEIQQLTKMFQSIGSTMEFARRLRYFHHYQRLALEDELKRMEEMAKGNDLEELQAVAPILREISDDKSVLNVTRARAQRLLTLATPSLVIAPN